MSESEDNSPKPAASSGFSLRNTFSAIRSRVQKELDPTADLEPAAQPGPIPAKEAKIALTPVRAVSGGESSSSSSRLKRILIIGGMDFFGAALVRRLNAGGFRQITLVDSLEDDRWKNFSSLAFEELQGFSEFEKLLLSRARPTGVYSHIFYLADWRCADSPLALPKAALALAAESNSRFISFASASSLGPQPSRSDIVQGWPDRFRPECRSGLVACLFDRFAMARMPARNYVALKHYRLFGSHERPDGALYGVAKVVYDHLINGTVPRLPEALKPGSPEGDRRHDFLSVAYAAEMAAFLAEQDNSSGIYEIGSGLASTPWDLIQAVFAAVDRPPEVEWTQLPFSSPSPEPEAADLSRLRELGWNKPIPPLAEAVAQYVSACFHGTEELPAPEPVAVEPEKQPASGISKTIPNRRKPFVGKAAS
ncbi:hypothetical protein BH09VER1_BH09VER1_05950 [soil metagenome]